MAITRKQIRQKTARSLSAILSSVIDSNVSAPTYTINEIKDKAIDNQRFRYAYLHNVDTDQFRLITSTNASAGTVTVQRDFSPTAPNAANVDILGGLDPEEWNDLINDDVLPDLYYIDRASITLVAGQTEYNVTSSASWLTDPSQVIRARLRDVGAGSTKPKESDVSISRFFSGGDGVVRLYIPATENITDRTIQIEGRRYYTALSNDTTTVNVNPQLVVAKARHVALQRLFEKYGVAAKQTYGMSMVIAERELSEEHQRRQSHSSYKDYNVEDDPMLVDLEHPINWSW